MARTCIICGGPTGSREHIFPAALGGRRTNKGIYCDDHNNGYSDLAGILSTQLELINVLLDVRGDHDTRPRSAILIDEASGLKVKLSGGKAELAEPEIISDTVEEGVRKVIGRFANETQVQEWIKAERAQGRNVQPSERKRGQQYVSGGPVRLVLGGPEGLRAIGYVAQTFLAHHFPEIARTPAVDAFKNYTRGRGAGEFVWWDYEGPTTLPANAFEFGHRILIGLDPASRSLYARVSLFSTLHFALMFGPYEGTEVATAIVDIDPLAEHPPNDIHERREPTALAVVTLPNDRTGSLSEAITGGRAQQLFVELLRRIEYRNRAQIAAAISKQLQGADRLEPDKRREFFAKVLEDYSQQILNLMRYFVESAKRYHPSLNSLAHLLDPVVAFDSDKANGLSDEATGTLSLARDAILEQMLRDFAAGSLDNDRIAMLLDGGLGASIAGQAIVTQVLSKLPER